VSKSTPRLDLLGVLEGHYAGEIVLGLIRSGAFELLTTGRRVGSVAQAVGVDARLVGQVLDFIARTTDLIERDGTDRYRLGRYSAPEIEFQFQKFIGAYGSSVRRLGQFRSRPSSGEGVNESALAAAFAAVGNIPSRVVKQLRRGGYRNLVDLGCGPASLLVEMALRDDHFTGVGIDQSKVMCRLARARVRQAGVASRLKILRGNVSNIADVLEAQQRSRVEAIHGRSLINAYFGQAGYSAKRFLCKLRSAFPGRIAFFVDYYSELRSKAISRRGFRLGRLHDLAQVASGQGIPPSNLREWQALYKAAGCKLVSAENIRNDQIRWFVHEVRLGG
jgi:SAM-dependent methyltransferase